MFSYRWFPYLCWLGVLAWAATIFYLSSKSGSEIEELNIFRLWDKAAHFLAFAAGAATLTIALRQTARWPWRTIVIVAALTISAYGWSDEWHQQFTPGRSAKDVADWTADTLGGTTGALLTAWIYARHSRSHPRTPAGP
jgi:VanZ family protein